MRIQTCLLSFQIERLNRPRPNHRDSLMKFCLALCYLLVKLSLLNSGHVSDLEFIIVVICRRLFLKQLDISEWN